MRNLAKGIIVGAFWPFVGMLGMNTLAERYGDQEVPTLILVESPASREILASWPAPPDTSKRYDGPPRIIVDGYRPPTELKTLEELRR